MLGLFAPDWEGKAMQLRILVFLCALLAAFAAIAAPDTSEPLLLVAQRDLRGELFESSIVFVRPTADGGHVGFIINRPTTAHLGDLFPEDEASKKVADPLYLGGPDGYNRVFAVVGRSESAGKDAMQMMPGVFLVADGKAVDRVIAADPEHARFFLGLVTWKPGELDQEIDRGMWFVSEPDAKLVLEKKTDGLWEELVRRSEAKAHTI
jgi:putative transcriptional regulator